MTDLIAFALTDEYSGTVGDSDTPIFDGGTIAVDAGEIRVGEELDAADGVIVAHADDFPLVAALDNYPALERVAVPDGAAPISKYGRQPTSALRQHAKHRGVDGADGVGRAKIIAALEDLDAGPAAVPPSDDYDDLTAKQIVERLGTLDDQEVAAVQAYEAAHENRTTVVNWTREV